MVPDIAKPSGSQALAIEAWAQGFMVGGLIVMTGVAVANMRKEILLHRLIVLELVLGMFHGTFIFTNPPVYNWYLSTTAIFLNTSWSLHNVIAWMKNKPFLNSRASKFYISTVIAAQAYWVVEIVANFLYFSGTDNLFATTRPYEVLFRDPWWVFTTASLFWNIKARYEFGYLELIKVSPRFGVLLASMILSICFIIVDVLSVTGAIRRSGLPNGLNPWWKLSMVFKCLTDSIVLDDFKTALDRLKEYRLGQMGGLTFTDDGDDFGIPGGSDDVEQARSKRRDLPALPEQVKPGPVEIRMHDWSEGNDGGDISFVDALGMDGKQSHGKK